MKLLFVSVLVLLGFSYVTSYKVLIMMAFASKSHKNVFDPVAEELAKRGNEVTVMSPLKTSKQVKGVTEYYLKENGENFDKTNMSFFDGKLNDPKFLDGMIETLQRICRGTFRDPQVVKILNDPKAFGFNVVILDAIFNDFLLAIGHHIGIPSIILSPGIRFASLAWGMNVPHPISYVPSGMDVNTDKMTFVQRFWNILSNVGFHHMLHSNIYQKYDKIIAEFLPNSPSVAELQRQAAFLITNTHPAISLVMPSMPYTAEIGGINCKPAKPLPKELEDIMASSGDAGVIYFSLGSVTKGSSMPLVMRDKVVEAFAKLPQKILWKYEGTIENLPKNIKLLTWAPQQDILAHQKTRLFISHGGGLSLSETVYHQCPMLGFPLSADQWGNMAIAVEKGYGEYLDWENFTVEDFLDKIQLMLSNDRYKKAAVQYSAILKDQPMPPAEKASYWIEYVARHKGASHLKSAADNLNFFQYFLLDVIGAILLVIVTVLIVVYVLIRKGYHLVCKNKAKAKGTKKTN